MAPGRKTGGKNFPLGNKYGGRPRHPEDLKTLKAQTKAEFEKLIYTTLKNNQQGLHTTHCSSEANAMELIMAKFIQRCVNDGDPARFALLADRVIGPVPRDIKITEEPTFDSKEEAIQKLRAMADSLEKELKNG